MRKIVEYIEVDTPTFVETSPPSTATWRFSRNNVDFLSKDIDAIPSVVGISFSPARVSLGKNLGERGVLTVTFQDHRHIMASEDFNSGTFFGKWRARFGTRLRNREVRWYQGEADQALSEMTVRTFIIDSVDGPNTQGVYRIIAKDVLKLSDDDRAQAPVLSTGFLLSGITAGATTATLSPSGIGNLEYPSSGYVAVGGEEVMAFTRSGDTLTFETTDSPPASGRGFFGTTAQAHDTGDRVQLVLRYAGENPAVIIRDLFVNYAAIPSSYIDLTAWETEVDAFLQVNYTANIAEPVSVKKLVSELIEQAALSVWWDEEAGQIRLKVLKNVISTDEFNEDNVIADSLNLVEQPNTRITQVWTYFSERNPLRPLDEPNNFRSVEVNADLQAETEFGSPAIKKIFSRWIPFGGRFVAQRVNTIQLARFVDPPRKAAFRVDTGLLVKPTRGDAFNLRSWVVQNTDGTPTTMPVQITRINPQPDYIEAEAEELIFLADPIDLTNRTIIIDSNNFNLNLRTLHDQLFPVPTGAESPAITVTFIVETGVTVGSTSTSEPAIQTGLWVAGVEPTLVVRGRVQGHGGDGGGVGAGGDGGTAFLVEDQFTIDVSQGAGEIFGGGGGGGGSIVGGGGGAGTQPGLGGGGADDGTADAGGETVLSPFGDGGGPGLDGISAILLGGGVGGDAGPAIDGFSLVTFATSPIGGDIRGPQIN